MEKKELEKQAIKAALNANWQKAINFNKAILDQSANEIEALNRLAYAFFKLGEIKKARTQFKKVLQINPYNPVASKNLKRLKRIKKINPQSDSSPLSPSLFLEESGKTKTIALVKLAPQKVLSSVSIGQKVILQPKRYEIEVRTEDKSYLGALPDDFSFKLKKLIKKGYQYQALIKNVKENFLSIFLKETKKGRRLKGQPSFTPLENKTYIASVKKEILTP